jgi:uncharacterized membrane protein
MTAPSSRTLRRFGRIAFALPMVAFGVAHLVAGDLTTRFARGWPEGIRGRTAVAYVLGIVLIVAGLAVLAGKETRGAAFILAALIALSLVFLSIPRIVAKPGFGGSWTNPAKYMVLLGGALLVGRLGRDEKGLTPEAKAEESPNDGPIELSALPARLFLSIFLTLGGIQHFVYESFVVTLIPDWIPNHVFWARFAGVALIAGGLGIWLPRTARLAGTLTGVMIFLWFVMLHIPRAAASPKDPLEWSGVFESLAMSGVAFLVAGSSRDERSVTVASRLRAASVG